MEQDGPTVTVEERRTAGGPQRAHRTAVGVGGRQGGGGRRPADAHEERADQDDDEPGSPATRRRHAQGEGLSYRPVGDPWTGPGRAAGGRRSRRITHSWPVVVSKCPMRPGQSKPGASSCPVPQPLPSFTESGGSPAKPPRRG